MIPYNHENHIYSLQKDVLNLIIDKYSPTLWMYFIKDDRLPNDVFNYSKIIQANSLEEAKRKIIFSNMVYLFKLGLLKMTLSFADKIINTFNIISNDCINCQRFLSRVHFKKEHLKQENDNNF